MTKTATKKATPSAPADDPVEAARAECARLNSQELRQGMLYRLHAATLAGVRRERGDAVLDAEDPAGLAREVSKRVGALIEEQSSFADAAHRARERRIGAIPLVFQAESDQKEAQAEAMEVEASRLEAESNALRAQVESHDDWGYFPAEGKVNGQYVPAVAFGAGPGAGGQFRTVDARGPKFTRLRNEAQALRAQAAQGRYRVAHQAGSVGANSVEDIISEVHADPMRIGPSAADIIAWIELALDRERRRSRTSTEDAVSTTEPLLIRLVWAHGIIDQQLSSVSRSQASPAGSGVGQTRDRILGEPAGAQVKA